jgi:restriction system protein
MTPRQYEEAIAAYFARLGYETTLTPCSHDFGVDVFATRPGAKLAIQAKMYGEGGRPVNREMILQLQGARDYFDCTQAVIACDARLTEGAADAAKKLGIMVLNLPADQLRTANAPVRSLHPASEFDRIWQQYVVPLEGKVIGETGVRTNQILKVDWSGVKRLSSNGKPSKLPIEIFRQTVDHLLKHGSVTRKHINDQYDGRGSSGVVLILAQVPEFEHTTQPKGLRLRASGR